MGDAKEQPAGRPTPIRCAVVLRERIPDSKGKDDGEKLDIIARDNLVIVKDDEAEVDAAYGVDVTNEVIYKDEVSALVPRAAAALAGARRSRRAAARRS